MDWIKFITLIGIFLFIVGVMCLIFSIIGRRVGLEKASNFGILTGISYGVVGSVMLYKITIIRGDPDSAEIIQSIPTTAIPYIIFIIWIVLIIIAFALLICGLYKMKKEEKNIDEQFIKAIKAIKEEEIRSDTKSMS